METEYDFFNENITAKKPVSALVFTDVKSLENALEEELFYGLSVCSKNTKYEFMIALSSDIESKDLEINYLRRGVNSNDGKDKLKPFRSIFSESINYAQSHVAKAMKLGSNNFVVALERILTAYSRGARAHSDKRIKNVAYDVRSDHGLSVFQVYIKQPKQHTKRVKH